MNSLDKIITICFLVAMVPIVLLLALLVTAWIVITAPITAYVNIRKRHEKDPWGRGDRLNIAG